MIARRAWMTALLASALAAPAGAQCAMCLRTARAQQAAKARALNAGILVLGAPPLLILGGFAALLIRRNERYRDD